MAHDIKRARERLREKFLENNKMLQELKLKDLNELNALSDEQLEQRLSPKIWGWLAFEKEGKRLERDL